MAFAATAAHSAVYGAPGPELSVEYAHYSACRRAPSFDPLDGTSPYDMLAALENDGQPAEAAWPYLETLPMDISQYQPPQLSAHQLCKRHGDGILRFEEAIAELQNGWPVIFGIRLSPAFHYLRGTDVLNFDADLTPAGLHAVLAVGFHLRVADNVLLLRNSWGVKWGDGGHGHVSDQYLKPRTIFMGVFRG